MSSEKLPPVVAALAERVRRAGYVGLANMMRGSVDEIMAIIAAHAPPDKLDELLAAMREFNVARRPNDSKAGILMWDDGSGQTVLPNMISFAVDTSSIGKAQWFDGKPGSAPASIRAATERLKPKPAPVASTTQTQHDGDCTIYESLSNGWPTDGVCTCGYGAQQQRAMGHDGEMFSAGRREKMMTAPAPAHVWRAPDATTPIDTWVWCRDGQGELWHLRHLANTPDRAWVDVTTSETAEGRDCQWNYIVVADPAHPDQAPPRDWTPQ